MNPVVPGHFSGAQYGNEESFYNVRLRVGEVQAIYYPEDAQNVSKLFVEYSVWVQHRSNGTAVTKLYDHCIAIDHFGALADFSFATYRADPSATRKDSSKTLSPGLGAKVVILCINGESTQGLILGGIRNAAAEPDTKADGHHLHSRFNGVDVEVNNDGELKVTYGGATKVDGTLADGVDQGATGTFVEFSKDGNVLVSDKDGKNSVLLDHVNDKVQVTADTEVDVTAPKVRLGSTDASHPAVQGDVLKELLSELCDQIVALTVFTAMGPSSPPVNAAAFEAIKARLQEPLSDTVFVKE